MELDKELDMWLAERRAQTLKEIEEMHLQDENYKRRELLKLDFLLLELEASLGLQDGIKLW